ncbi:MAG TPA: divalent-cation tolerance protein CutA [Herpetosiphonaceae bacterium]
MSDTTLVVLVTAPTIEEAAQLGRALVEERLAACANLVPGLRSIYRWQGAIQDDAEVLLLIKTSATHLDQLTQRIVELHSYETPEVLALPVVGGSSAYLQWLAMQVGPEDQP